ncbi:MAG: hypothetical protein ACK5P6_01090 [Pseudobdellovibrionaceae bacterium]
MQTKRDFWLKFLRVSALFILVTGLLPSLAIFEATQEPWRLFFDVLSWPMDNSPAGFSDTERQLSAVLGGVLVGWAWLLYQLAHPGVFNQRIRTLMVQSGWVWFLLDSGGSILAGLPLNAVSNIGFAVILLVPLRALKSVE